MKLGLLHPGAMGVSVGAALRSNGHDVCWLAAGRSSATRVRAEEAGFSSFPALEELLEAVSGVISVCPPDAALAQAQSVVQAGFDGLYLDANAVAPATARRIHELVGEGFVDGGIVGPPARQPGSTRLYVAGPRATEVVGWFAGSALDTRRINGAPGSASALKMCYAAYTKGTSALLLIIRALAEAEGVEAGLLEEWELSQPALAARSEGAALGSAPKAWRFVGEMEEIAATFAAQNLPGDFHLGAAEVYRRLEGFKDSNDVTLAAVVEALLKT
jgi:3-hydroxyisobutyrate dehydrogenase-like beta-hydroxyacid dehydrogenase